MNSPNTVVVKFKDGQIMIFSYSGPLLEFLSTLSSYTGDSRVHSYMSTEDFEEEDVEEHLKSETKYIIKYCPQFKNKGYKVMIGKFWKRPNPETRAKIISKVSSIIRKKQLNIFKKKPNYHKNTFELKIFDAEI